jgi:hypothetical protein
LCVLWTNESTTHSTEPEYSPSRSTTTPPIAQGTANEHVRPKTWKNEYTTLLGTLLMLLLLLYSCSAPALLRRPSSALLYFALRCLRPGTLPQHLHRVAQARDGRRRHSGRGRGRRRGRAHRGEHWRVEASGLRLRLLYRRGIPRPRPPFAFLSPFKPSPSQEERHRPLHHTPAQRALL